MSSVATDGASLRQQSGSTLAPPIVAGLVPEQVKAKSKWSGVPSFRTSEGLPPPSISFGPKGGVYVWGKVADDVEVSSKNADNIEDGKSRLSGFRRLAYLCGGLAINNDLGNHEVPSNAQFTIPFPDSIEADKVLKVDAGDMHIVLQDTKKTLYSVGVGGSTLQKVDNGVSRFGKCNISGGQVEGFSCGREHTVVALSSESKLQFKNAGGSQMLESIPLSDCSLDGISLSTTKIDREPIICSFGDGNIACVQFNTDESQQEIDCLVMWRNNVEGNFLETVIQMGLDPQGTFSLRRRSRCKNGIGKSVGFNSSRILFFKFYLRRDGKQKMVVSQANHVE